MRSIKEELNLNQKKILLRLDLNVPLDNNRITDTTRIDKILPTIKFLLKNEAKIIILSHVGRPKGKVVKELSLEPIKEDLQKIQDVLDIEVIQFKIAGFQQVGAVMATSEKGTIVHPETDEEDMKTINNLLGGNIEAATINGGIPFVSSGILANSNSIVVGSLTNGPEIMMLTRAFLH